MSANILFESEHQELFALGADLSKPFPLHVPSALGTLGYYVCLRVPESRIAALAETRVHIKVGGLRPDDVDLGWGDGIGIPQAIKSSVPGEAWILHSRANLSRGDGVIEFSSLPADLAGVPFLLCTWPRFLESGEADQYVACQADPQWAPNGIPLGGIGCGKVELSRDGRFRNFSGNNNQDMPFEEPDGLAGASLQIECGGEKRVIATRKMNGIKPVPRLDADLAFPQARLSAPCAIDGVDVAIRASGSFIPHDIVASSLPGCVIRWTVRNGSAETKEVKCSFNWPNLVGRGGGIGKPEASTGKADGNYMYWDAPEGGACAEEDNADGIASVILSNKIPGQRASADGRHCIAMRDSDAVATECGDPRLATISRTVALKPGETASFDMALAWEMPHAIDTMGVDRGLYWQNNFSGCRGIACELLRTAEKIFAAGDEFTDLVARSSLPSWMGTRLCNCCYPLVTNSVFGRDGRFSINEGPTEMSGCYGTLDQRIGAHPATQLLFPELNARELRMFGERQAENGGVLHDFGCGHLEREARDYTWPDLTCSFAIQCARHAWSTGDESFAAEMWPHVRRAILRHREWAAAGNGVAQVGKGLGTSYDGYHYHGTMAYVGTLWVAALDVAREWAAKIGDGEFIALTDGYADLARARMDFDLWNGSYYRAYAEGELRNENVHGGTLAGEYYDRMLAGRDVLAKDRLEACAQSLIDFNGNAKFAVPPDEVSADLGTFTEYGWLPYVECFCMAPLAILGKREFLAVWERILKAMDDDGHRPCDTRLMYQPVSGKPSWGSYYMTAPASWLVYDAMNDFFFRAGEGILRFNPMFEGEAPLIHPLFWAKASRKGNGYSIEIVKTWCDPASSAINAIEVPSATGCATIDGTPLERISSHGEYAIYSLPSPIPLAEGAKLKFTLK